MDQTTARDVRAGMRRAADEYLDTDMADGDLGTCADTLAAGFRDLDTGTVTTADGLPAFTEDAPTLADLLAAARPAIPALELLGDFIGNAFDGKAGIPGFDRCAILLALKKTIAQAESLSGAGPAGRGAPERGRCATCHTAEVPLVAALPVDNCERLVCSRCHRDARIPTVSLAALDDARPVYVLARGDVTRLAGREVTDEEAERVGSALGYSTLQEAVNGVVEQVCGLPDEYDQDEEDPDSLYCGSGTAVVPNGDEG